MVSGVGQMIPVAKYLSTGAGLDYVMLLSDNGGGLLTWKEWNEMLGVVLIGTTGDFMGNIDPGSRGEGCSARLSIWLGSYIVLVVWQPILSGE